MLLIGLLIAVAFALSSKTFRWAIPFESLAAVSIVGLICIALFQTGRLG
ncbi:MAG: hypothetical protein AB7N24_20525 [Dehalococcoidia bacterium]